MLQLLISVLQKFAKKDRVVMIVTEQEDAEVLVNGRLIAQQTPCLIHVNGQSFTQIAIRKTGHYELEKWIRPSEPATYIYENLERVPLRLVSGEA